MNEATRDHLEDAIRYRQRCRTEAQGAATMAEFDLAGARAKVAEHEEAIRQMKEDLAEAEPEKPA